jgi:hypothetical protein
MRLSYTIILALSIGSIPRSFAANDKGEMLKCIEATFEDIQKRVLEREERTNGILWVRPFGDEGDLIHKGRFQIKPVDDTKVIVRIYLRGKGVVKCQECELLLNDEIKAEIARQEKLRELQLKDQKELNEQRAFEIQKLSGGKLKPGMQLEEIEKTLGRHYRCLTSQQFITMVYDDYTLVLGQGLESMTKAANQSQPLYEPEKVLYEDEKKLEGKR